MSHQLSEVGEFRLLILQHFLRQAEKPFRMAAYRRAGGGRSTDYLGDLEKDR
jgi:hypothetical protein